MNDLTAYNQNSGANPLTEVEAHRAVAEVQAAMTIAKKFPRDVLIAIDRIKNACQRPKLAESATYEYARGGTSVSGPSIRLAEAISQNWGNIVSGIRELEQRNGESTVEAYAWDLETNTKVVKQFQVKHWRDTKKGGYQLKDSRDIYERVANDAARRLRACILAVIPADVVEMAVEECEKTLKANVEITPESIKKMLAAFKEFGVTKEMIEKRIQRKMESILPAQFMNLRKIYTSMNDGMSTAKDWFEVEAPTSDKKGVAGVAEMLKPEKTAKVKSAVAEADEMPEAQAADTEGDVLFSGDLPEPGSPEYDEYSRRLDREAAENA